MNSVRFSIIENDFKWDERRQQGSEEDDADDISSESGEDIGITENGKTIFNRIQRDHSIWDVNELEETFKEIQNSKEIFNKISLGNLNEFKDESNDINLALLISSWYGCLEKVIILLENHKANPNFRDSKGRTALHFACSIGDSSISKSLLDYGADPNVWDKDYIATPLHCAASSGSVECILLLLKRKAQINMGIERRSALHFAVDYNYTDCVETLLKYGASPNTPQVFTETPLHTAAGLGYAGCLKLLLQYGADVRSQFGKQRLTALHLAAEDDYADCVRLILEHGSDVDARTADKKTPLHLACLSQCIESLELLIKFGADVNAVYKDGRTALHAAITKQLKCLECIDILLKAGINVNRADKYGYTSLHMAALNELSSCVYKLIVFAEHGGDVTARTNGNVSALTFIVRRTPQIIPKIIEKLDASIKVNEHEIGDVDCEIKLDFRLLVPCLERRETELLLSFIEVGQKKILKHPLCETFLFLKWRKIRKFFLMSLSYHAIFVMLFTSYVLGVYVKHCEKDQICASTYDVRPIGYLVIFFNLILMMKEIFQMTHGIYGYAKYWENWLQWLIIFGVFLCVTPETLTLSNLYIVPEWQHHIAAVIIFLVWLELMMMVGRFPIFGLYVQMFTKVAVNFLKFFLAYCCLLIAFGLSFCVLLTNQPAFENITWALLKTVIMMSGELEFEDIFFGEKTLLYPVTSHIFFFSFVLLVTVILTNLLVGLAVNDIQGLQDSAGLDRLIRQAELVSRLESLFFSRILKSAPSGISVLCQRSALLRTSRYQLQFITRPNDPRDRQLSEELKLNIYKLVAERQNRAQNLKRNKIERNLSLLQKNLYYQSKEDDNILRPSSALKVQSNINSANSNIFKNTIHTTHFQGKDNEIEQIKEQMSKISKNLEFFSENITKQISSITEDIVKVKIFLEKSY